MLLVAGTAEDGVFEESCCRTESMDCIVGDDTAESGTSCSDDAAAGLLDCIKDKLGYRKLPDLVRTFTAVK